MHPCFIYIMKQQRPSWKYLSHNTNTINNKNLSNEIQFFNLPVLFSVQCKRGAGISCTRDGPACLWEAGLMCLAHERFFRKRDSFSLRQIEKKTRSSYHIWLGLRFFMLIKIQNFMIAFQFEVFLVCSIPLFVYDIHDSHIAEKKKPLIKQCVSLQTYF